jgi:DNA-binding beta-propeller fold protein YncE
MVYVLTLDKKIYVIDGSTNKVKKTLNYGPYIEIGIASDIAVDSQKNKIYLGTVPDILVLDGNTNDIIARITMPDITPSARAIALNMNTHELYVTNYYSSLAI